MSEFIFTCPHCGSELEVDDSLAGQVVECPSCRKGIVVPRSLILEDTASASRMEDVQDEIIPKEDFVTAIADFRRDATNERIFSEASTRARLFLGVKAYCWVFDVPISDPRVKQCLEDVATDLSRDDVRYLLRWETHNAFRNWLSKLSVAIDDDDAGRNLVADENSLRGTKSRKSKLLWIATSSIIGVILLVGGILLVLREHRLTFSEMMHVKLGETVSLKNRLSPTYDETMAERTYGKDIMGEEVSFVEDFEKYRQKTTAILPTGAFSSMFKICLVCTTGSNRVWRILMTSEKPWGKDLTNNVDEVCRWVSDQMHCSCDGAYEGGDGKCVKFNGHWKDPFSKDRKARLVYDEEVDDAGWCCRLILEDKSIARKDDGATLKKLNEEMVAELSRMYVAPVQGRSKDSLFGLMLHQRSPLRGYCYGASNYAAALNVLQAGTGFMILHDKTGHSSAVYYVTTGKLHVDGERIDQGQFLCLGTKTYTTTQGASKTVYHFKELSGDELILLKRHCPHWRHLSESISSSESGSVYLSGRSSSFSRSSRDSEKNGQLHVSCPKCDGRGTLKEKAACQTCLGTGKVDGDVDCSSCEGKGKFAHKVNCPSCGGRGKTQCGSCRGSGKTRCSNCNGSGKEVQTRESRGRIVNVRVNCPACGGARTSRCWNCSGRGYSGSCDQCDGRGRLTSSTTCQECRGKGQVPGQVNCRDCVGGVVEKDRDCPECRGTGKIEK